MLIGDKFLEQFFKFHKSRAKKQYQYKQSCQGKNYTIIIRRVK